LRYFQWFLGLKLADHSCGGSRGITAFPFDPQRGTVVRLIGAGRLADKGFAVHFPGMQTTPTDEDARHRAKMANRKAIQDAEVAAKTIEKGLLVVHTGKGKGKSTAAFGLMLRALGRGFRCGVVQFGKGAWQSGERAAIERFGDQVEWHTLGEGFTWETQDRARDVAAAEKAWAATMPLMADPTIRLIVLDELNIALRYDHLDTATVIAALKARRADQHIIVTGRNAKPEMIEAADLVTEMTLVKHHFASGVKAQEGIEF
jgi:cob(I)alamin adenosyltransferase